MDKRKTLLLGLLVLGLISTASAKSVQVDGLTEENVNSTLENDGVRFSTSYLNKTIQYKDVFVPEYLQDDLKNFKAQFQSQGNQEKLKIQIQFQGEQKDSDDDMPDFLSQYQYQAQQQSTPGQVKFQVQSSLDVTDMGNGTSLEEDADYDVQVQNNGEKVQIDGSLNRKIGGKQILNDASMNFSNTAGEFSFDTGVIKPQISAHYEHLIVNHQVRSSVSPKYGRTVRETQEVYSGEDTEKVTFGAESRQVGNEKVFKNITYDNRFEPVDHEIVSVVMPESANLSSSDFQGLSYEEVDFSYQDTKNELQDAGVSDSIILDDLQGMKRRTFNVTFPEDSNKTLEFGIDYKSPVQEENNDLTVSDSPEFYTYIVGSGGALEVNSTTTMYGDHTYDTVLINSTLRIKDYNGTAGTGKLNISASDWINVTSNGQIDGYGAGYNGGTALDGPSNEDYSYSGNGNSGQGPGAGGGGEVEFSNGNYALASGGAGGSHFTQAVSPPDITSPQTAYGGSVSSTYGDITDYNSLTMGSGGGGGAFAQEDFWQPVAGGKGGGDGGGALKLKAKKTVILEGSIDLTGGYATEGDNRFLDESDDDCGYKKHSSAGAGGPGAGGKAVIVGKDIQIFGSVDTTGRGGSGPAYYDDLTNEDLADSNSLPSSVQFCGSETNRAVTGATKSAGDGGVTVAYGESGSFSGESNLLGQTYTTTKSFNTPPGLDGVNGPSGNVKVDNQNPSLGVDVSDPDGDSMTVEYFLNGNSIGSNSGVTDGSDSLEASGLEWGTQYNWSVQVSDGNGGTVSSQDYQFTTQSRPGISSVEVIRDEVSDATELSLGLDDKGESDIIGYSGLSSVSEFTNSSLRSSVVLPFSSSISVSDIPGAVSSSRNVDVSRSISSVHERSEYGHDTNVQRVEKTGIINSTGDGFDYNWSLKSINGTVVQGLEFTGSVSAGGSSEEDVVAEGDWIVDESTSSGLNVDQGQNQSFDTQYLMNGTTFNAVNERDFTFHNVNISDYCPGAELKNVSSGPNSISCGADSVSGDFIKNEKAYNNTFGSGSIQYGSGIEQNYTADQPLGLENTEDFSISLNASRFATSEAYCSVEDSMVDISGLQNGNSSILKSCEPGEEISYDVSQTETQDYQVYSYTGTVNVFGEAPSEVAQEYWIERDRLTNYGKKDPGETTVSVDGQSEKVTLDGIKTRDGTDYVVIEVAEDFGQSSLHDGTHEYSLEYKEKKSSETTSGGTTIIGGSSGSDSEPVASENNTEYSWNIYAEGSDSQYFQILGYPGRSFDKTIVLENTGDSYPALEIDCVSSNDYCEYVDVGTDRVEFSEGFESTTVDISGNIPEDAQFTAQSFSIRVTDPSNEEGSEMGVQNVDFEINMASIVGRILDSVGDLPEVREFEVPGAGFSIPYVVFFIPLLSFVGAFGLSETFTQKYTGIRVGTSLILALVIVFVI